MNDPVAVLLKFGFLAVLFLFLGIGKATMITLVVLASVFPVLISTFQGVRALDPVLLETARTFQVSRARMIVSVILPASLPMILAGMRVALGIGLVLVILAEMLAGEDGIGFRILDLERSFQTRDMFAWIVVLVPVALAIVWATAVRHEEAYLEAKFGAPYADYKRSVRRWL